MYWVSSGSYTCNWIIGQVLDDVPDGKDIKWKVDILRALSSGSFSREIYWHNAVLKNEVHHFFVILSRGTILYAARLKRDIISLIFRPEGVQSWSCQS